MRVAKCCCCDEGKQVHGGAYRRGCRSIYGKIHGSDACARCVELALIRRVKNVRRTACETTQKCGLQAEKSHPRDAEGSIEGETNAYWTFPDAIVGGWRIIPAAVRDVDARRAFSKSLAISFGRRKGVSGKRRASFSNFVV